MTNEQKRTIAELRSKGATYAKIGEAVGIPMNTVKTYCRTNFGYTPHIQRTQVTTL